jgi:ELWxxDGT repeat protein
MSDGTAQGTRLWLDFNPGPATGVLFNLIEFEGDLVFDGLLGEEGASRRVVARVDREGRVTELFSTPGDSEVRIFRLTPVGGRIFFLVDLIGGDADLYVSDGTEGGARFLRNFGDTPLDLTGFQGLLYFAARSSSAGTELWRSDGSPEGTVQVRDIHPGAAGSFPSGLTVVKERLYFSADDGEHGEELWVSDGTEAGTVLAADLRPGAQGSSPFSLYRVNKRLYFYADDGVHGREPWKVDGGTARLVADIAPGAASSQRFALPGRFTRAGERLYFPADDGTHGEELWALPLSEAGCPRGSR